MFINKVFIYGNITAAPELKSTQSGKKVTTFNVATNRTWTDDDGKKREEAEFHRVVVWAKQAELVCQYLGKGSGIFVEGRLQTRSWEGNDGKKNYTTEVVAERIQFGPRKASRDDDASGDEIDSEPANVSTKSDDLPF